VLFARSLSAEVTGMVQAINNNCEERKIIMINLLAVKKCRKANVENDS